jgi:acetoacetyl-CoA synthetase
MGTAEFYEALGEVPEVADSLVVHVEDPAGGPGTLWCFVVPAPGVVLDEAIRARLRTFLRTGLSPRHVPDRIEAVSAIPRTLSGKKLEVPIKRILSGMAPDEAVRRDAVANPEVLDEYLTRARS